MPQYNLKLPGRNQAVEMDVILIFETSVELGALHHDGQLVLREVVMRGFLHFGV
jgi:hypothetical protein